MAYQRAPDPPVDDELRAACAKALHVIEPDGTTHVGSRAVLFVFHGVGWKLTATLLWYPPLQWLVELGYRIFANNRRFFAKFVFWKAHPDVADF